MSRLVRNLDAGEKQVVVVYGTSLTASGAWVQQVSGVLHAKSPGHITVVNGGGSGQWSEWGVANIEERVIRKKPDTVFIEFSINDSVARFEASVAIARANLETMISRILKSNPDCEIILMTMTPGDKHPQGHASYRKDIEAHYALYRSAAAEHGLIDHYPNWIRLQAEDPERFRSYVPDSIHPTDEGCAEVVTPVVLKSLGVELPVIGDSDERILD